MSNHPPNPPTRADHPSPPATAADRRVDDALKATPRRYHATYGAALRDLEAAVCACVDELRARGLGPEKVLVTMKAHVAAQAAGRDDLLVDVVRWCIARYYDGKAASDTVLREPASAPDD